MPIAPIPPLVAVMYRLVAARLPAVSAIEPDALRLMVLVPVRAMSLASSKSPVMVAVTLPLPLMLLSIVVLTFLLKANVAPPAKVTDCVEPKLPVAPPLPTCKAPILTVVVPV